MSLVLVPAAVVAGLLLGLSLGALGGGGSILAVPVLVLVLGQSGAQATTGSLVVVGVTALVGAVTAARAGNVLRGRGLAFGAVAISGAAGGATASQQVPEAVLLGSFACHCPRAVKVLVTATAVGLLTGFLGVGGGFLVVPALVLSLGIPMAYAAGTSLVVITITSAAALAVRVGNGPSPDWWLVAMLTASAVAGGYVGARAAARTDTHRLQAAFTGLVLAVATVMAWRAIPALT